MATTSPLISVSAVCFLLFPLASASVASLEFTLVRVVITLPLILFYTIYV